MFGINFNKSPQVSQEQQEKTSEYEGKINDLIKFVNDNAKNNRQDSLNYLNEQLPRFRSTLKDYLKRAYMKGSEEFRNQELELLEFEFNQFKDDILSDMNIANSYDDFSKK